MVVSSVPSPVPPSLGTRMVQWTKVIKGKIERRKTINGRGKILNQIFSLFIFLIE